MTVLVGRFRRADWLRALAASALVLLAPRATADAPGVVVPTGRQEYFVLGYEQHLYRMLARVYDEYGAALATNRMNSVVSAVVSADDQIVTYDHWEDGLDADPWNTTLAPGSTTLVLGDNDTANGRACDWMACRPGHPADALLRGDALTFASNQTCTGNAAPQCYVAIPRAAAALRFDGGDRIVTSGGPLSIIHDQNPNSPYSGGSTEVLPKQAYTGASSYSIPVGEDQFAGDNTPYEFVEFAAIDVVAFEANTQVFINSPGVPTVSLTLQAGQHYTNCYGYDTATFLCNQGAIDSVAGAAGSVTINAGTKLASTKPVAILLFTAAHGNYATDFMPVLPDLLHGNDYILPSPGDNPDTNGDRPLNIYAYDPDPANSLVVDTIDTNGAATLSLAANETRDYSARTCAGACPTTHVPSNSSVRLTANRNFWGVAVHDHQGASNDWGYAWLATSFLKSSYTVPYAPGVRDPVAAAAARATYDGRNDTDCRQPPQAPGPGACDSINRAPVFVAAAENGTYVKVDFDNDGVYDIVDQTSDDLPDNGQATDSTCGPDPYGLGLTNCLYLVNALQVLRVYDYTDYDNTGTRVVALGGKKIAMSYGQDTDQAVGSDDIQDTGYTVYPLTQRFLDPVLVVGKDVSPTVVSGSGGQATFTLHLQSFAFERLTSLSVTDFLPAGLTYVPGSTLITYPNLAQGTSNPTIVDGNASPGDTCPANRFCLSWALSPDYLDADQVLTVRFTANVGAGTPAIFANEVEASAVYSGRTYRARGAAELARTDVTLTKVESDDGTPEPGDVITYTLNVTNHSPSAAETNIQVTDAIPSGTTYLTDTVSPAPPATFGGVFSQAQNAVVWTTPSLGAGASATLSFQVRLNADLAPGTVLQNRATYQSTQTPGGFSSNETSTTVVGPVLAATKSIVGGVPPHLHPLEAVTFEVQVTNSGAGTATSVRVSDALAASNATYVPGTLERSLNGGAFLALTDAADGDEGTLSGTSVEVLLALLGPSADVRVRFQARVNSGTIGLFLNNQATVSATQVGTTDTNLVQVPITGNATVVGRVFGDLSNPGVLDAGEPGLANVAVVVTDAGTGYQHTVYTDAFGLYTIVVPAGVTRLQVQRPAGYNLTTGAASEDQSPTALANQTISAPTVANVGYSFPPLTVTKTSSAGGTVAPGQTITYTVTATNTGTATLTNLQINDPVPAGTTYVANSAQISTPTSPFRINEYYINGAFGGTTYDLTLGANLAANFFVIVQPEGRSDDTGDGPDVNYASVVAAGNGVGDLPAAPAANQIRLQRGAGSDDWVGVVTVVECLQSCDTAGFRLLGAERVAHAGNAIGPATDTTTGWTDLSRVMLVGGANGAGCDTTEGSFTRHKNCHVRLWPSGTNTINWTRNRTGAQNGTLTTATSTVMVVQWGSEWTVQRRAIFNGGAGGANIDAANEYNTAPISPVLRSATWVWGTGHTAAAGLGTSAEGVALTLGAGANPVAIESQVAAGIWSGGNAVSFDVYALSHPGLAADHRFQAVVNTTSQPVTVNGASSPRMALVYNGHSGTGTEFPSSLLSARYTNAQPSASVTVERTRTTDSWAAWVQGLDFGRISGLTAAACNGTNCFDPQTNPNVLPASTYSLPAGASLVYSYQVRVDLQPAPALASIDNTATASATGANPAPVTVSDPLRRPAVDVDPNNAGYERPGQPITFTHTVTNTSSVSDSYTLHATSEKRWRVELIDPDTGVVIRADANGDGTWDGEPATPAPTTGTLAPQASKEYRLRVWIPQACPGLPLPCATPAEENTVFLTAASDLSPSYTDSAKDEITVLPSSVPSQVVVTPDNSGVVRTGEYAVYSHQVVNLTGVADTFDLLAVSSKSAEGAPGWGATLYWDTNGDGVYTEGADLLITNTAQLAPGTAQLIFVVVQAGPGATPGMRDVTHLTATSRNNDLLFGAATDTSTVVSTPSHDLSGGGSRVVGAPDTAIFPGTIVNLGTSLDRYDLSLSASSLYDPVAGRSIDELNHPTELWVYANGDSNPPILVASDAIGDGTWDFILSGWNQGGSAGAPDVPVPAGGRVAYELRRPVDPLQKLQREFVTLNSQSINSPSSDPDNVTATWVFAALTRAGLRGVRIERAGEVSFVTSTQAGTASFVLYQTDDPTGALGREALHDEPVLSPVPDSITPILYRVPTRPVKKRFLMIEEKETDGDVAWKGPIAVGDDRLRRAFDAAERLMDEMGIPRAAVQRARGMGRGASERGPVPGRTRAATRSLFASAPDVARLRRASSAVKIEVSGPGRVAVPAADLGAAGLPRPGPGAVFHLTRLGLSVPYEWVAGPSGTWLLSFDAPGLSTDYSGVDVFVLSRTAPAPVPTVPLTSSAEPETPGFTRVERNAIYVPSLPVGTAPWQWDLLFSGAPWPDPGWDPAGGDFDLPDLTPSAAGPVPLRVGVVGYTNHRHAVSAAINGQVVGTLTFEGTGKATLSGSVPAELLHASGNKLTIDYSGEPIEGSPEGEALLYLDHLDLAIPVTAPGPAEFALIPYEPTLPPLRTTEYLIVTHPLFRRQAERIAGLKRAEGLSTAVVETDAAYDRFSGGVVEPRAIQALVRAAAQASRRLRFVLLVGDDSFDPRDFSGYGVPGLVPSLYGRDSAWGLVPSETPFADLDDDGRPDVAIGRLPLRTPADAQAVADKIATQAERLAVSPKVHLLVVDNSTETDAPFLEDARRAVRALPEGPEAQVADLGRGTGEARAALVGGWQAGTRATHYFGHGGLTEWADEQVLTTGDVASLGATWKPTVLFTWACLSQWYEGVQGPSLNESLLLHPGGGALASFGPAGITLPAHQARLAHELYRELARPGITLGEAIRNAKAAAIEDGETAREAVEGFHLFGDPALRLAWPESPMQ